MKICKNPILEGFYPDPSICKVEDRYYMVNSTFAFYPGIPVWCSRDLQNWEQVGNVLERPSQLQLGECTHSQGIYAPTIRYHDGMFYLVTTNVGGCGNFLVTAERPEGPWSDPYVLDADGIDPSLFFEEDGTCYYIGTRERTGGGSYFGDNEIWIQRLNLEKKCLEGESIPVWYGFMKHAIWPEGPHIYKKDGWYYLLHAEGGTAENHCIAVARSRKIDGPYEGCPNNPIFTHRHLGRQYPITCVGHGDLVEDEHGNWYMVLLACRTEEGYTLRGRETFLAKVEWEDDWPVVNPGIGRLEVPDTEQTVRKIYRFQKGKWPLDLMRLRTPGKIQMQDGYLRIWLEPGMLTERKEMAFAAVRQQHNQFYLETSLELPVDMESYECAGLAYMQNEENQIRLELSVKSTHICLKITSFQSGMEMRKKELELSMETITEERENNVPDQAGKITVHLRMEVKHLQASFEIKTKDGWRKMGGFVDVRHLATELAGGFTGCVAGVYASSNGRKSSRYVDVYVLEYGRLKG